MPSPEDILNYLYGLEKLGIRPGLASIKRLLDALGNPHTSYPSIHVAGTNGKGSTAAMLSSVLEEAGLKTGLYTSPHLERFNERIRTCTRMITRAELVESANRVKRAARVAYHGTKRREATFFEFTTAMAFTHFKNKGVDVAIVECGMGGRLDATNVLTPLVSVITNIGPDHTEHLGTRVGEVAFEKAGIIKKGVPVVTGVIRGSAGRVVERAASALSSQLYRLGNEFEVRGLKTGRKGGGSHFDYHGMELSIRALAPGLRGAHQVENAAMACAALELISKAGLRVGVGEIRRGLKDTTWPGRLEVVGKRPLLILDAAHNAPGAASLAAALKEFRYKRLTLVAGIMRDKDIDGILAPLVPLCDRIILAAPKMERAAVPAEVARSAALRKSRVVTAPTVSAAVRCALEEARTNDAVCVAGSVFTVGEARSYLKRRGFGSGRGRDL